MKLLNMRILLLAQYLVASFKQASEVRTYVGPKREWSESKGKRSGAHLAPQARRRLAAVLLGWPYFQSSYSLLTHCILSPNNLVRMKAPNYSVLWCSSGKSISSLAPGAGRRHAAVLETMQASKLQNSERTNRGETQRTEQAEARQHSPVERGYLSPSSEEPSKRRKAKEGSYPTVQRLCVLQQCVHCGCFHRVLSKK